jgi:hypothetical protein
VSAPPPRTGVQPVPLTPGRDSTQGMIAPMNQFVDSQGVLSGVSFRFLHGLFSQINQLQTEVQTLQQRLQAARIP